MLSRVCFWQDFGQLCFIASSKTAEREGVESFGLSEKQVPPNPIETVWNAEDGMEDKYVPTQWPYEADDMSY